MAFVLLSILGLYLAIGLVVGAAIVVCGVDRVDTAAKDASFIFRVVILLGCVGLWLAVLWQPVEPVQDSVLPGVEVSVSEEEAGGSH